MKLTGTLLAAGVATLLGAVHPTPASAATHPSPAARPAAVSPNLLGGTCAPALSSPVSSNGAIILYAELDCWSSIDFAFIDMQLRRIDGGFDNGVPGSEATCMTTSSWSLNCGSSVPCQTGYYYAVAEFEASSTSGYTDIETQSTPTRLVTC